MKKKLIFSMFVGVSSIALFVATTKVNVTDSSLTMENVESLAKDESSGKVLYCKCSKAIIYPNDECLSSNNGNICAQSQPGGNISCREYDSNCGSD